MSYILVSSCTTALSSCQGLCDQYGLTCCQDSPPDHRKVTISRLPRRMPINKELTRLSQCADYFYFHIAYSRRSVSNKKRDNGGVKKPREVWVGCGTRPRLPLFFFRSAPFTASFANALRFIN